VTPKEEPKEVPKEAPKENQELKNLQEQLANLQKDIKSKDQQNAKFAQDLKDKEKSFADLKEELSKKDLELENSKKVSGESSKQSELLKTKEHELAESKQQVQDIQKDVAAKQEELKKIKEELQKTQKASTSHESHTLQQCKKQISSLEDQLKKSQEDFTTLFQNLFQVTHSHSRQHCNHLLAWAEKSTVGLRAQIAKLTADARVHLDKAHTESCKLYSQHLEPVIGEHVKKAQYEIRPLIKQAEDKVVEAEAILTQELSKQLKTHLPAAAPHSADIIKYIGYYLLLLAVSLPTVACLRCICVRCCCRSSKSQADKNATKKNAAKEVNSPTESKQQTTPIKGQGKKNTTAGGKKN